MELLSVIRRWRYRDHYSIREISRRTGLSRNTVRKYLRSDSVEPKFRVPDRPSKLDPYADKLSHMLRQEIGKSRKQKRTIKAALNDWLEMRCQELWAQTQHGWQLGSVAEAWAEEARHLMPLSRPFDGFVEYAKRVSPTCLIHLERNRYSVPASFANRPVSVRVYPERIVVAAEGQIVCEHARVFARSHERKSTTTVFDWRHYLAVIQRKPGALRNGAPFAELPPAFRALQQRMLKTPGGDREIVEILALVLQHDEQTVLAAVELALEAGMPTKTHILNLLHRLVDGKPIDPLPVNPPNALTLTTEPQANVGRYDDLRKAREARHAS